MLNDLYPLLRTVQPAELNYTLNALAGALEGRGDKIGENLMTLDGYLKRMNPQLPAMIADFRLLAQVTDTYADVMPQLAATLRNTVKTGNTLLSKEEKLNAFLIDMAAFSDTTKEFLDANGDNIIRLGQLSEPILALLRPLLRHLPVPARGHRGSGPRLADDIPWVHLPHQPQDAAAPAARLHQRGPPGVGANNAPTAGPAQPADPLPRRSRTSTTA